MKNQKIVVYTALFGNYSGLIEQPTIEGVDYICYTDQDFTSNSWEVKKVTPPVPGDDTRSSRYYKINPHKHLKEYETSVFIDANYLIFSDFTSMVADELNHNLMISFDHNKTILDKRNCVYEEHSELVKIALQLNNYRDNLEVMQKQIDFFKYENYPAGNGLIFSAVLIRKHLNKDVIALMELWWEFVSTGSKRDQLSFDYCVWKLNFKKVKYLDIDLRSGNPWFHWIDHKLDFSKDLKRIKRRKKLEKIFSKKIILYVDFLKLSFICIFIKPYALIKTPIWYKKIKSNKITLNIYTYILNEIIDKKLSKRDIKNLITQM